MLILVILKNTFNLKNSNLVDNKPVCWAWQDKQYWRAGPCPIVCWSLPNSHDQLDKPLGATKKGNSCFVWVKKKGKFFECFLWWIPKWWIGQLDKEMYPKFGLCCCNRGVREPKLRWMLAWTYLFYGPQKWGFSFPTSPLFFAHPLLKKCEKPILTQSLPTPTPTPTFPFLSPHSISPSQSHSWLSRSPLVSPSQLSLSPLLSLSLSLPPSHPRPLHWHLK